MANDSKLRTDLQPDPPLQQRAGYALDANDRQYIDNQIRTIQNLLTTGLLRGAVATWGKLDSNSAAVAAGQGVCLSANIDLSGLNVVTKVTPTAAVAAGSLSGIALQNASPGGNIQFAISGIIPPVITGFTGSDAGQFARVNKTTAVLEATASPSPGDFIAGTISANGAVNVTLNATTIGSGGGESFIASGSIASGKAVCSANDANSAKISQATSTNLNNGGGLLGIATESATDGLAVTAGVAGQTVAASVTGLSGPAGKVGVDATGSLYALSRPTGGEQVLGTQDDQGNVTIAPQSPNVTAPRHVYNVVQYGADPSGVADSYAAIMAAINAVPDTANRTGTVFFPAGTYLLSRPIFSGRTQTNSLALEGEYREGSWIEAGGYMGPCMTVASSAIGPLPTGAALLTGAGNAASNTSATLTDYLKLSEANCLALDGLAGFSCECTIYVTNRPAIHGGGPTSYQTIISSSGGHLTASAYVSTEAFGMFVYDSTGSGNLDLSCDITINGSLHTVVLSGVIALNTVTHVAMTFDGTTVRVFAAVPGGTTTMATGSFAGTMTQDFAEETMLFCYSDVWPSPRGAIGPIRGRVDSLRISNYARHTANYTAPTAKFDTSSGSNVSGANRTLLLLNFDQDVDCFTVGTTWVNGSAQLVYSFHFQESLVFASAVGVSRLTFYSPNGVGFRSSIASFQFVRDCNFRGYIGLMLDNNAIFSVVDNLQIGTSRLGAFFGGVFQGVVGSILVDGPTVGVILDVASIHASQWYIQGASMQLPLFVGDGVFSGRNINISSEPQLSSVSWRAGMTVVQGQDSLGVHLTASQIDTSHMVANDPIGILVGDGGGDTVAMTFEQMSFRPKVGHTAADIQWCTGSGLSLPTRPVHFRGCVDQNLRNYIDDTTSSYDANLVDADREGLVKSVTLSGTSFKMHADDWMRGIIELTGSLGADCTVTVPKVGGRKRIVHNATTGGHNVLLETTGGTPVTIANGARKHVYCDGTDIQVL